MTAYRLCLVLAAGAVLAACGAPGPALPYYADADFTPQWFEADAVPDRFHAVPPFALTDQRGEALTEATLDGRITVANFFFASCPGICPMTMGNMARVQSAVARDPDVMLISHSVTPERDSVAVLAAYAEQIGAVRGRWFLVTGGRAAMYALGRTAYFADDDLGEPAPADDTGQASDAFLHTESFYLLDPQRRIRGIYNGLNTTSVDQLVADIETLRREIG